MAKWMSDVQVEEIVEIILKWPLWKDFGWEEIRQEIQIPLNFSNVSAVWSRQQLPKYDKIKNAFEVKKKQIREKKGQYRAKANEDLPPNERALKERVAYLEAKILNLTEENDRLHTKFERWQYNAQNNGMTEAMLEKPMSAPNEKVKKNKEHKFFKDLSS